MSGDWLALVGFGLLVGVLISAELLARSRRDPGEPDRFCRACGSPLGWHYWQRGYDAQTGLALWWRRWTCSAEPVAHRALDSVAMPTEEPA